MTISPSWDRVQGDTGDTLVCQLDGVVDLVAVTSVVGHIWNPRSSTAATNLTATVLSAVDRTVTVQLGAWLETADPVTWLLELQVTSPTQTLTWPAGKPGEVRVRPQGA